MEQSTYFTELTRRLREQGFESFSTDSRRLKVQLHGKPVLFVSPNSEVFLLPAGSQNAEASALYHRVAETAEMVSEYVEAVQNAHPLRVPGLEEKFRLLADFGGAVLAGRERTDGSGYQFATWIWNSGRAGVSHGHYYEGDFRRAKEDFAVRSGLISRAQLFTPEELTELYRATDYFLEEGPEPDSGQQKALRQARTKIEYTGSQTCRPGWSSGWRDRWMDQRCDSGGAKKGAAAFLVPQALCLERSAEPPRPSLSACQDCPYPGHSFLCRSRDGRCLRDRVRLLRQRETGR